MDTYSTTGKHMCTEILAGQVTTTACDYRHKIDSSYHYAYQYDDIGNRRSSLERGVQSAEYVANSLNQYTSIEQLVLRSFSEGGSNNFTYDADGNLTNDGRNAYVYDGENRLVSVTPLSSQSGSCAIENAYDHRSRRIRKVVKLFDGAAWLSRPMIYLHSFKTRSVYEEGKKAVHKGVQDGSVSTAANI